MLVGESSRGDRWEEGQVTPSAAAAAAVAAGPGSGTAPSCQHTHNYLIGGGGEMTKQHRISN